MVRLGFIRDMGQSPDGAPRVFLAPGPGQAAPTLLAGHGPDGTGCFELQWEVPADPGRIAEWTARMAESIADLGLEAFCLDPLSVAQALDRTVEEALILFGQDFWPRVDRDYVVYILVGETGREPVYQAVRAWERAFAHVRFDSSVDLELHARETPDAKPAAGQRRGLRGLIPRLFKNGT